MATAEVPELAAVAASAVMVPMLPCADVDAMAAFWTDLGLQVTYRQLRPNPYIALELGGIALHYYGMPDWDPDASHSTCAIAVADTRPLYEAFAAGLRARHGTVPVKGLPRVTRPRERANNAGLSGFSLVDPAGNWIRVSRTAPEPLVAEGDSVPWRSAGGSPLARAVENAVVIADSHGDVAQARKVLAGAVRRAGEDVPVIDRARALAYLVELAVRSDDDAAARELFTDLEALAATDRPAAERAAVDAALAEAAAVLD